MKVFHLIKTADLFIDLGFGDNVKLEACEDGCAILKTEDTMFGVAIRLNKLELKEIKEWIEEFMEEFP